MSVQGTDLLASLGGGVRSQGLNATRPVTPVGAVSRHDGAGFAAMLEKASAGKVESGSPVLVEPGLDLNLTDDELAALSRAADRAEASGAERALVLLDSRVLLLDVTARQVVDSPDLGSGAVLSQVDAVIRASTHETEEPRAPGGPSGVGNQSLLDALSRIDDRRTDRAGA